MTNLKLTNRFTGKDLQHFINEASKYKPLTAEQEKTATKEQLIKHNMLFVVSVAKVYRKAEDDMLDLIQEGLIGLCRAAEEFDRTKNIKFISYAVWWIRAMMMKYNDDYRELIRIPVNQSNHFKKIDYIIGNKEYISDEEIKQILDISDSMIQNYNTRCTFEYIDAYFDTDTELERQYASDDDAEKNVKNYGLSKHLLKAINQLEEREQKIIKMLYFNDIKVHYPYIGKEIGLSPERVRQLETQALKKLKSLCKRMELI